MRPRGRYPVRVTDRRIRTVTFAESGRPGAGPALASAPRHQVIGCGMRMPTTRAKPGSRFGVGPVLAIDAKPAAPGRTLAVRPSVTRPKPLLGGEHPDEVRAHPCRAWDAGPLRLGYASARLSRRGTMPAAACSRAPGSSQPEYAAAAGAARPACTAFATRRASHRDGWALAFAEHGTLRRGQKASRQRAVVGIAPPELRRRSLGAATWRGRAAPERQGRRTHDAQGRPGAAAPRLCRLCTAPPASIVTRLADPCRAWNLAPQP